MLAKILSQKHGFDCTVLFAIHKENGTIDPNTGVVPVPDARLARLTDIAMPQKVATPNQPVQMAMRSDIHDECGSGLPLALLVIWPSRLSIAGLIAPCDVDRNGTARQVGYGRDASRIGRTDHGYIPLKNSAAGSFGSSSAIEAGSAFADQAGAGVAIGMILAIFRRFWAAAARWNSSLAPLGPRRRRRSSFRMRLRWANSISTFLRWRRETR